VLAPALALAALVWLALLVVTPLAPPSLATLMYTAGSVICDQIPERRFHLAGFQIPVCARCLGIYAGAALAASVHVLASGASDSSRWRILSAADARRVFLARCDPDARDKGASSGPVCGRARTSCGRVRCRAWCRRRARGDERGYATLQRMPATTADRAQPDTTALSDLRGSVAGSRFRAPLARATSEGHSLPRRADSDVRLRACGSTGALFPFQLAEPLVRAWVRLPILASGCHTSSRVQSAPAPVVSSAITYEYGNTFVIVAGLLNMLVVLDAFDIAKGRK
jgi:hypothetical protein